VNFWCHLGAIPETTVCCPGGLCSHFFIILNSFSATNPCSVPLAPGTGNAGLARWSLLIPLIQLILIWRYYNADDRQCVSFQYNGKRGNQNNFLTQDECQNMCPGCSLPKYDQLIFYSSRPLPFVHWPWLMQWKANEICVQSGKG
jgi:hypothetical protein